MGYTHINAVHVDQPAEQPREQLHPKAAEGSVINLPKLEFLHDKLQLPSKKYKSIQNKVGQRIWQKRSNADTQLCPFECIYYYFSFWDRGRAYIIANDMYRRAAAPSWRAGGAQADGCKIGGIS